MIHSHDLPPLQAFRRYFDDFRALAEVNGLREPLTPRYIAARVRGDVAADRAFMRREGRRGPDAALARPPRRPRARPQPRDERRPAAPVSRPVLFVTNHAPPFRVGAFAALHEREDVVFALIGGDVRHGGGAGGARPAVPGHAAEPARRAAARRVRPLPRRRSPGCRAASRCRPPTPAPAAPASRSCCGRRSGRTRAPPRTRCRTCPLRHLYRSADAIATYGPHVSAYVRAKGARGPVRRGAAERRRRVLVGAGAARPPCRLSRRCLPADWRGKRGSRCSFGPGLHQACQHHQPRWFWSAAVRSEPGPPPPARPCS